MFLLKYQSKSTFTLGSSETLRICTVLCDIRSQKNPTFIHLSDGRLIRSAAAFSSAFQSSRASGGSDAERGAHLLHREGSSGQFARIGVQERQLETAQRGQADLILDANDLHQLLLLQNTNPNTDINTCQFIMGHTVLSWGWKHNPFPTGV